MLWLKFGVFLSAHIPDFPLKLQYLLMTYDAKFLKKIAFYEPPTVFPQHTHSYLFFVWFFFAYEN